MGSLTKSELSLVERINEQRAILRLINTLDFKIAYDKSSPEEQQMILQMIDSNNKQGLIHWLAVFQNQHMEIEELSIRELRRLAQALGVRGYLIMTKAVLVSALYQRMNNVNPDSVKTN